jgi:hypothetical protein
VTPAEDEAHWAAVVEMWGKVGSSGEPADLEKPIGPLVDRLLLTKGIGRVESETRSFLLLAFWKALRDALESRNQNAAGNYTPDLKAERFPR